MEGDRPPPAAAGFDANPLMPRMGAPGAATIARGPNGSVVHAGAGRPGRAPAARSGAGLFDFDRPVTPGQRLAPVSLETVGEQPAAREPLSRLSSVGDGRSVADILRSVRQNAPSAQPASATPIRARTPKIEANPIGSLPMGGASGYGGGARDGWGGNPLIGPGAAAPVVVAGEVLDEELDAIDMSSRHRVRTTVGSAAKDWMPDPSTEESEAPKPTGGAAPHLPVVVGTTIDDPWGDVPGNSGERISLATGQTVDGVNRNTLHEMSFHGDGSRNPWELPLEEEYLCRVCGSKITGKKLVAIAMCFCALVTSCVFALVVFGEILSSADTDGELSGRVDALRSSSWAAGQDCIGGWNEWSVCSASCHAYGAEIPTQTRAFRVRQPASEGGQDCMFADGSGEFRECNTAPCGAQADCDGTWSEWFCTATCLADGIKTRQWTQTQVTQNGGRSCSEVYGEELYDGDQQEEACSAGCPVDCQGRWSNWDSCTVECGGGGTQSRTYTIDVLAANGGQPCTHQHGQQQWQSCNEIVCDAVAPCEGSWGGWSECSDLCGGGSQTRVFSVSQDARNGGAECAVSHGDFQLQGCNSAPCPTNCEGNWGDWGDCDARCANDENPQGGVQTRRFTVVKPAEHGGLACVADDGEAENRVCNTVPCDQSADCIGRWSEWGECSTTCGGGEQTRRYTHTQSALGDGTSCPFDDNYLASRHCNEAPCPAIVSSQFEFTADVGEDDVRLAVAAASGVDLGSVEITDIYPAVESHFTITGTEEMLSDENMAQFAAGLAAALGVAPADVEMGALDSSGRRRYLQDLRDIVLGFSVKAAGGSAGIQSSISSPSFLTIVATEVNAAAGSGSYMALDPSMMSDPAPPSVKTVVKFDVTVPNEGSEVDDVFTSLSPDNSAVLASLIPGVSVDDMVVKRPKTDIADGACSLRPCQNGAPCFGGVHVFMCGNPLSAMMVLSARCQSFQNGRCVQFAPIGDDFGAEFAEELSSMIGIPSYRIIVSSVEVSGSGEVEVNFEILPVASSFDENDVLDEDDNTSQEEAIALVENLQRCGSTTCAHEAVLTDPDLATQAPVPTEVTVGGLGVLDVEVVEEGGFVGCPPGFDAVTCGEDADECASSPCRHGAPCFSETIAAFDMYMCGAPVMIDVDIGPLCFTPSVDACAPSESGCDGSTLAKLPSGFMGQFVNDLANRSAVPAHRLHVENVTLDDSGWRLLLEVLPAASSTPEDTLSQLVAASQIETVLGKETVNAAGVCLQVAEVDIPDAPSIGCPQGYSGINCERVEGGCSNSLIPPCVNGGVCVETAARELAPEVHCRCPRGYYGDFCQFAPDACTSSPCRNGGLCHRNITSPDFRCECPDGWAGLMCTEWSNPCTDSQICPGKSTCVHTGPDTYECRDQPVMFSYIHYHTRPSTYSIAPGDTFGSAYTAYLQENVASRGYCQALLTDASKLRNQDICPGGSSTNVAFFYSFTMTVGFPGMYSFRMHADWGSGGGFVCFGDTCQHHAGDLWGYIYFQAPLLAGVTKVRMLGFEDCCDGHAELEFQLPVECAREAAAESCADSYAREQWLNVDSTLAYECPGVDGNFECPSDGWLFYRFRPLYAANQQHNFASVEMTLFEDGEALPATAEFGRFVPVNFTMNAEAARRYCEGHHIYSGLASIHSEVEQGIAAAACQVLADPTAQTPHGCWIGLQDDDTEGEFMWLDGSAVDYLNWAPGEPNNGEEGEDAVEMDFRPRISRYGEWNDATRDSTYRMYPLCETHTPPSRDDAPSSWTAGSDLTTAPSRRHDAGNGAIVYALDEPRTVTSYLWRMKNSLLLRAPTQWAVEAAASASGPWTPIHSVSTNRDAERYQYIGCFADADDRSMEIGPLHIAMMTPDACAAECSDFTYFGLQNGDQCFCGSGYSRYGRVSDSACSIPCPGSEANCGGTYRNSVYLTRTLTGVGGVRTCMPTRYEVFHEELSQAAAEAACVVVGGHLASLHSQADQHTVQEMIQRVGLRTAWIGFHDRDAEAGCTDDRHPGIGGNIEATSFAWTDNSPVDYENWADGEPNDWLDGEARCDGTGNEDCTEMWQNGETWNDFDCEATKAFVCGFCGQGNSQRNQPWSRTDLRTMATQSSVRGPYRTACVGNSDPLNLALHATVTGNFAWQGDWNLLVNGLIEANEWTRTPGSVVASCREQLYVTVDLQTTVMISMVSIWHYYGDQRRYCGQKVAVSPTGEFRGEETVIYDTGLSYGPPESPTGHVIDMTSIPGRFIRHWCSRSTASLDVHFSKLSVQAYPISDWVSAVRPSVVFGCIDHWTTQCTYDANSAATGGDGYDEALAAFVACSDISPQPPGFCHVELDSASHLSNQDACQSTVSENIGFHTVIPFTVMESGPYRFRFHVDYGLGGYIGIDGTGYHAGDIWGHVLFEDTTLAEGEHYFESLGFDGCCDGHSELEVHVPCDLRTDPWRTVVSGPSATMMSLRPGENCSVQLVESQDGALTCGERVSGDTVVRTDLSQVSPILADRTDHAYTIDVPDDMLVTFNSCGSNFDTYLRVFSNDMETELAACDNCGPCGDADIISVQLARGTYKLIVTGTSAMEYSPPSIGYENQDGTLGDQIAYGWHEAPGSNSAYEVTRVSASEYSWSSTSYDWIDIVASGAVAIPDSQWVHATNWWQSDDGYFEYHLPFVFPYFNVEESVLHIGTNGYLTFGQEAYAWGNSLPIPTPQGYIGMGDHRSAHDSLIGIFWTDMDPGSGGAVYCAGGTEEVVILYDHVAYCCGTSTPGNTFQAILHNNGDISMHYQEINTPVGAMLSFQYEVQISCGGGNEGSIGCGDTVTGSTVGSQSVIGQEAPEHYYTFTAHVPGRYTFNSCSDATTYDTWLRVYSRDFTTEVAECDDCGDCPTSTRSILEVYLVPGDYLLVVEGWASSAGQYEITMQCELPQEVPNDSAVVFSPVTFESRPSAYSSSIDDTFPNALHEFFQLPSRAAGYCRATITNGNTLRNRDICANAATTDVAVHIQISAVVRVSGMYRLRFRVDWSNGGYLCVDGDCARHLTRSEVIAGRRVLQTASGSLNLIVDEDLSWGFVLVDVALLPGRHSIEMLGFDQCCNNIASLDVSLPLACTATIESTCATSTRQWFHVEANSQYPCAHLDSVSSFGEVGQAELNHNAVTVHLTGNYGNPVIIAGIPTRNGAGEIVVRVKDVQASSFSLYAQETRCGDNWHTMETASWMVVESGTWDTLQAGMLQIQNFDWYRVKFHNALNGCINSPPSYSTGRHVAPAVEQMDVSMDLQHITYRLAVTLQGSSLNVYSIYGTDDSPLSVPAAHQVSANVGGVHVGGANPLLFSVFPAAEFDSWLTVGVTEGATSMELSSIGLDWEAWTETSALIVTDGAVFWMEPDNGPTGSATVAQLTVPVEFSGEATMGLQGRSRDETQADWQDRVVFDIHRGGSGGSPCSVEQGDIAVLSQVMSDNGPHFVKTRQRRVDAEGFDVRLEEDVVDAGHNMEDVGWVAVERSSGHLGGLVFEAGATPAAVSLIPYTVSFEASFTSPPSLFGSIATFNLEDPAHLRLTNAVATTSTSFVVEKPNCADRQSAISTSSGCTFTYFANRLQFDEAEDFCVELGGHLASIHDQAEQEIVDSLVPNVAWIGYNDRESEAGCTDERGEEHRSAGRIADSFVWTDGTPSNYERWAAGEPNDWQNGRAFCDGTGNEDCAHVWDGGRSWNDVDCDSQMPYVCSVCGPMHITDEQVMWMAVEPGMLAVNTSLVCTAVLSTASLHIPRGQVTDASTEPKSVSLHGSATVDEDGFHFDGWGDFVQISNFDYTDGGQFAISLWATKDVCTAGPWEYVFSHAEDPTLQIDNTENSNVNLYVNCNYVSHDPFFRYILVDADATFGSVDMYLGSDDRFHPGFGDWVHVAISVFHGITTFVNGAVVHDSYYQFAVPQWRDHTVNTFYPTPSEGGLSTSFNLLTDIFIGGRMDLNVDRHFSGSIYGIAVFDTTITGADAWCMFADIAPPALTGETPVNDPSVIFGCIDHWTTQCTYDINQAVVDGEGYDEALAAFQSCATAIPQPPGFCHVELDSASHLSNQDACQSTVSENIGFHTVIPFTVMESGPYRFRFHVDYGLGGYIGIDGAGYHAGDIWGHVLFEDSALLEGEHYFESLGFDGCCDDHSELEVHIPCDLRTDPWRTVVSGPSATMVSSASPGENCTETYIDEGRIQCGETKEGSTAAMYGETHTNHNLRFSVDETSIIKFDSCRSTFDTLLRVYTSDLQSELGICDNCGPCGLQDVLSVRLAPGEYVLVVSGGGDAEGHYYVSMQCGSGLHGSIACGTSTNGTTTGELSMVGSESPEHYYAFTAYTRGMYQFNSCGSNFDTFLKVYNRDATTEKDGCDDCGNCPSSHLASILTTQLEPGDYLLVVEGYANSHGYYEVSMECRPIAEMLNSSISCGQTVNGTTSEGENSMLGNDAVEHVYSFTVETTRVVTFDSCASNFDTVMHVFDNATMTPISFADDECNDAAIVRALLGPGVYFLVVEGYGLRTGVYEVLMSCQLDGYTEAPMICGSTSSGDTRDGASVFNEQVYSAREHLYPFTLSVGATVTFEACESAFDVRLRVVDAVHPQVQYDSCESVGPGCSAGELYMPVCNAGVGYYYGWDSHRSVIAADLPPGDFLLVVEGAQIEGMYSVTMTCPLELTDPCERAECYNDAICVAIPGNITHPNGDFYCECPPLTSGPDCRSNATFGEVGSVALSSPERCVTPEEPDINGLTCAAAVGYGYSCATLIHPPYSYDCHCTCNGNIPFGDIEWHQVELAAQYFDPIVVAGVPSASDDEQVIVRIRDIVPTGFEIGLQEPRCMDKTHGNEEVSWIVMEAGWHRVMSSVGDLESVLVQAGRAAASAVERFDWYRITYAEAFSSKPTVLTQVSTYNDLNPVWSRIQQSSATGFEVTLQEDDFDGLHFVEDVSWIALPANALGHLGNLRYQTSFVHGVTHELNQISFSTGFESRPSFFGELTSLTACCGDLLHRCDGDPALLRLSAGNAESVTLFVDEVVCNAIGGSEGIDWLLGERVNDQEQLSWAAIEPGQLLKAALLGCDGIPGTGLQFDSCGVCGGDGTSCECWSVAEFEWDELSNSTLFPGRQVLNLPDDGFASISLPFDFQFFGVIYESGSAIQVYSNGFIRFGSSNGYDGGSAAAVLAQHYAQAGHTSPLPARGAPGPMLAVYWGDLNPTASGSVYTWHDGTRLIVEWAEVPFWNTEITVHFQAVLMSDGTIEMRYLDIQPSTPRDGFGRLHQPVSIGWVNALGNEGVQVGYGTNLREVRERIIVPHTCTAVLGCDNATDSGLVKDRCSVCGGDGTSCEGCTDPSAISFESSASIENGSCVYDCLAADLVVAQPVWGDFTTFMPSEQHDSSNPLLNITFGGGAFADRYGLHIDGAGDYAVIDNGVIGDYASDASFAVSFWFTKTDCTNNLYEYMYSHGEIRDGGPLDRMNSNINIFMSCNPRASLLDTGFVRTTLVDHRAASADPGLAVLWDWALHDAGDFDSITDTWIAYTLTVTPMSTHTYVDGAPILEEKYGFHYEWADCLRNPAFPNPADLNTALEGFAFQSEVLVGGRADLDEDRHFWGAIAGLTIYDEAITPKNANCQFDSVERAGGITAIPENYMGCTDPAANNHSPSAGIDDGSCLYGRDGCWDYAPMEDLGVQWLDIASQEGSETPHNNVDDKTVVVQIPFSFPYFGRNYSRVAVADNGYVTFADPGTTLFVGEVGPAAYETNRLPSPQWPNNQIAALWTDLAVEDGQYNEGDVYTWGNETVFGIEWAQIPHYDSDCFATGNTGGAIHEDGTVEPTCLRLTHFELLLYADGSVRILYKEAPPAPTMYAAVSVGWEDAFGISGQDVRYNDATFPDEESAVVASPACFVVSDEITFEGGNSCLFANDGECDDGSWPGVPMLCPANTDTTDCSVSPPGTETPTPSPTPAPAPPPEGIDSTNSCVWANDNVCDDGRNGDEMFCPVGTDENDCTSSDGADTNPGDAACPWTDDGVCDDGSQGGEMFCAPGTDVNDCAAGGGRRLQMDVSVIKEAC